VVKSKVDVHHLLVIFFLGFFLLYVGWRHCMTRLWNIDLLIEDATYGPVSAVHPGLILLLGLRHDRRLATEFRAR